MSSNLLPVAFHDTTLFLLESANEPFVPMRPVVEGMGLDWGSQYRKLHTERFSSTIVEMTTVAEDGKSREMTCLPLRKLPGWLMTIQPNKVPNPATRERVLRFQHECDDVLWEHWSRSHSQPEQQSLALEPAYLTLARNQSMDHLWACYDSLKAAGKPIPKWEGDDNTIVAGFIASALQGSRFLLYFDNKMRMTMQAIPSGGMVVDTNNPDSLESLIREGISGEQVPHVTRLCLARLEYLAKKGLKKH